MVWMCGVGFFWVSIGLLNNDGGGIGIGGDIKDLKQITKTDLRLSSKYIMVVLSVVILLLEVGI